MKAQILARLLLFFLVAVLPGAALAQGNAAQAQKLAKTLSEQQDIPVNVRLRFQIMGNQLPALAGKGDSSKILTFFSTTRILFWNRPASQLAGATMRDLETQVVGLARGKGFNLDLPPVGYSGAGTAGGAAPSPNAPASSTLLVNRATRQTLGETVLRAEEMGTQMLSANPNARQLLALRDSLSVLRQDLNDNQVSSDAVRNVLLARANYLAGEGAGAPAGSLGALDTMAEALRTNFPPESLRQARGGQLSI